jgi:hypothetical protein
MRGREDATVPRRRSALLSDPSFERLLGDLAWRRLSPAIRERFRWRPAPGGETRYGGTMAAVRASRAGWILAQFCRLIGTPLAPRRGRNIPVEVALRSTEAGSVRWERRYRFPGRRPVSCVSVKHATALGLVECVGRGFGTWLRLNERDGALHFDSTGYFWRWRGFCVALPDWLTPGALHVVHSDLGAGRFRFRITLRHAWLGETFHQDGVFEETRS